MMKEILLKSGDEILRVCIVFVMMLTTIATVELRWMKPEVWIFYGVPMLLLLGFAIIIWRKQKFYFTLTDTIAVVWLVYFVGRTWIGNEWPCRMEFLRTVETFLLYVGLRVAFDRTKLSAWVLIGSVLHTNSDLCVAEVAGIHNRSKRVVTIYLLLREIS